MKLLNLALILDSAMKKTWTMSSAQFGLRAYAMVSELTPCALAPMYLRRKMHGAHKHNAAQARQQQQQHVSDLLHC